MDREAGRDVEHRRDHAAVQDLPARIADQLGPHVEAQLRRVRIDRLDLQAEHAVERHVLLEHLPQLGFHRLSSSDAMLTIQAVSRRDPS